MTLSRFTTSHVRTPTAKGFFDVTKEFESRLGRFDPTILHPDSSSKVQEADVRSRIEAMAGSSGFMLFSKTDHGALLTLFDKPRKAIQYLVGNPLIALQMTRRNPGAGLYAPLRVLIYEEDRKTFVEYDKASSLFGQFKDPDIDAFATTLDQKLEALVTAAIK